MNNTTSLAGLQSGSQYQWSTLNTYYNRNIINTTLTSAQALNQQQAEIGDERLHIPTLDNLLKLGQSTADMTARNCRADRHGRLPDHVRQHAAGPP